MNRFRRFIKHCFCIIAAFCVWLATAGLVLADGTPASSGAGEGGSSDYVLSYMVVGLAIVLGMLVVGRASNRRDREHPSGYVEKKILADE